MSTVIRLEQHGLEVEDLPEAEQFFSIHFRDATELATRTLAIHTLLGVIFHSNPKEVVNWAKTEQLLPALTEREKTVFSLTELSEKEMMWKQQAMQSNLLTWRAESLYVLLWALGKIPSMLEADEQMDGSSVVDLLPELGESIQPYIQSAKLRPKQEILDELHYYYFLRHFMQEIYEQHGENLGGLDPMLVEERCYALFWIACADELEWDVEEEN